MSKCIKVEKLTKGIRTKGTTIDMCKALEDMRTESRIEGIAKGLAKGQMEGIMEGRMEGIMEGEAKGERKIVCKLYQQGLLSKEMACKMLSISQHEFDVLLKKEEAIQ